MKKLTLSTDSRENIIELIDYAKKFIKEKHETQKNLIMKLLEFFLLSKKIFGLCYQDA